MKKILYLLLGIIFSIPAFAREFEYTYEGKSLAYTVLDEEARTCITRPGSDSRWPYTTGNKVSGDLVIPEYAIDANSGSDVKYKVVGIGLCAFYKCSDLNSVVIPETVTDIGDYAFSFTNISTIDIPQSVANINELAFSYCKNLTSVVIPESISVIGYGTFSNCYSLSSVTIPESVTEIGSNSFYECTELTNIVIPESVASIGSHAFLKCAKLSNIKIPSKVKAIEGKTFAYCSNLKSITLPEDLTSIGGSAFQECTSLTTFMIPSTVTSINGHAFDGCANLTSVYLPSSLTSIGGNAGSVFVNCPKLDSIYYNAQSPLRTKENNFSSLTYLTATLYVPENAVEEFKKTVPWKNFNKVVAHEFADVEELYFPSDLDSSWEVYTYGGMRISESLDNLAPGIYIARKGTTVKKLVVR